MTLDVEATERLAGNDWRRRSEHHPASIPREGAGGRPPHGHPVIRGADAGRCHDGFGHLKRRGVTNLVLGSAAADTIRGARVATTASSPGAGTDSLRGDAGTDVCIGGAGTDTFHSSCETRIQSWTFAATRPRTRPPSGICSRPRSPLGDLGLCA